MNETDVIEIARQAIYTGVLVSAPLLGLGLLVGMIVAVFQATTQINEQTLVFVSKILATALAVLLFGTWMIRMLTDFTITLYNNINSYLGL
jgi:flagellar biosynthetic protein FliQ